MISSSYRALLAESGTTQRQKEKQKETAGESGNLKSQNKSIAVMQYEHINSVVVSSQPGIIQHQQWLHPHVQTHQIFSPHYAGIESHQQNQHLSRHQHYDSKVHQMQQLKSQQRRVHSEENHAKLERAQHHQEYSGEMRQDQHNKGTRQHKLHNQKFIRYHQQQYQQPIEEMLTLEVATTKQKHHRKQREPQHEKDIEEQQLVWQTSHQYPPQQFQQVLQQQFGRFQQHQNFSELPLDYRSQQQHQTKPFKAKNMRQNAEKSEPEQQQTKSFKKENKRLNTQSRNGQQVEHRQQQQQKTPHFKTEEGRRQQNRSNHRQESTSAAFQSCRNDKSSINCDQPQHSVQVSTWNRSASVNQQNTGQAEVIKVRNRNRRKKQSHKGIDVQQTDNLHPMNIQDEPVRVNENQERTGQAEVIKVRNRNRRKKQSHKGINVQQTDNLHPMNIQDQPVCVNENQERTGQAEVIKVKNKNRRKKQNRKDTYFEDDMSLAGALGAVNLHAADVILDDYNSDLNAEIGPNGWDIATRNTPSSFHLLWAGSKANFGVHKGKVFFEAKVIKNLHSECIRGSGDPNVARIGWSSESSLLALGEEPISFGYESSRKFYVNNIQRDYGDSFNVNDVIGALLDLDSNPATVSFMKNGTFLGVAESFSQNCVGKDQKIVMYPHVFLKNCKVTVNFGQYQSWYSPPQGYKYIGHLPSTDKVASLESPKCFTECQVIMIVGLPASGKTTWAKRQQKESPEKRYNILGTDLLIERMGFPNLVLYRDRFDKLYQSAEKCFKSLLKMAATKCRNYILDQTNVFESARKKKMAKFSQFCRIAAVIQPSDQELERRSRERADEQPVPDWVVREMKANYSLPTTKSTFDVVNFIELDRNQTQNLVTWYNRYRR